jgi:ABC-type sugar transport system ATPase subunit
MSIEPFSAPTGDQVRSASPAPFLELRGLARAFGETRALTDGSFHVGPGEIHALAGENGSGKSTLIKILSGVLRPDAGEIRLDGASRRFADPRAAQAAGIGTVYQETLVVPELSVQDNIFIGTEGVFRRQRSQRDERVAGQAALSELGLEHLDLDRELRTLSLADQQLITIARAIARPWRLLILDEGTSALDASGRDRLFEYLRRSRADGRSILFTSHRMDEVQGLADVVTVLRQGAVVATQPISEVPPSRMLELMAGDELPVRVVDDSGGDVVATVKHADNVSAEAVVRVADLRLRRSSSPFSIDIRAGEILGVAGLEGHGQAEFSDSLCGLYRPVEGTVEIREDSWKPIRNFGEANRHGIAHVPRDRKTAGLFAALSTLDNFAMALLPTLNRLGIVRKRAVESEFRSHAQLLRLRFGGLNRSVSTLSGGNQQKVLLGRWLTTRPRVLVLNDPLRGVDVTTKEELYALFRKLSADGLTIVLLSSEILELLALCDRIAVFYDGDLQTLMPSEGATEMDVIHAMFGASAPEDRDE